MVVSSRTGCNDVLTFPQGHETRHPIVGPHINDQYSASIFFRDTFENFGLPSVKFLPDEVCQVTGDTGRFFRRGTFDPPGGCLGVTTEEGSITTLTSRFVIFTGAGSSTGPLIPESSTILMMGSGLGGLISWRLLSRLKSAMNR